MFAREGRGGGEAMPFDLCETGVAPFVLAAKGSFSGMRGVGDDDGRLFFLASRGFGFCKELRTLGGESTGVLDLCDGAE